MKRASCLSLLGASLILLLSGCNPPLIDTTIINRGPALRLLEFDYPSASFGVNLLPAGGQYHYRFRIEGSGPLTVHFQDGVGHSHTATGPAVHQGQVGSLIVTVLGPDTQVHWDLKLSGSK